MYALSNSGPAEAFVIFSKVAFAFAVIVGTGVPNSLSTVVMAIASITSWIRVDSHTEENPQTLMCKFTSAEVA